jgi:hypothetical protein
MSNLNHISTKLRALEIIFTCPLWAKREDLTNFAVYDAMLANTKDYALAIADERYEDALTIASTWTAPLNEFLDNVMVNGDEAAQKMVAVYNHYMSYSINKSILTT